MHVSTWEASLFSTYLENAKDRALIRARKTATRKLLLARGDVGMHKADEIANQAVYFSGRPHDEQARWISMHLHFLSFDMIAAHILPQSLRTAPVRQYQKVFLPRKVVRVSHQLLWLTAELINLRRRCRLTKRCWTIINPKWVNGSAL